MATAAAPINDPPPQAFKGRRVLVTGAGTGLGRGMAARFADAGAAVVLHYSRSAAGAEAEVARIISAGGKAWAIKADLADVEAVRRLGNEAVARLGGLDVLVNNSGISLNLPFAQVTPEQFDQIYNVNVRAGYFLIQTVLPALTAARGVVINISSIHAYEGFPGFSVYAGTRAAVVGSTRQLAIELAPSGVRVVGIAPGDINVENKAIDVPGYDPVANGRNIPAGFMGQPQDIAEVALFLASPGARFILGQTVIVDGGTTSWLPFGEQFRQHSSGRHGQGYVPGFPA